MLHSDTLFRVILPVSQGFETLSNLQSAHVCQKIIYVIGQRGNRTSTCRRLKETKKEAETTIDSIWNLLEQKKRNAVPYVVFLIISSFCPIAFEYNLSLLFRPLIDV